MSAKELIITGFAKIWVHLNVLLSIRLLVNICPFPRRIDRVESWWDDSSCVDCNSPSVCFQILTFAVYYYDLHPKAHVGDTAVSCSSLVSVCINIRRLLLSLIWPTRLKTVVRFFVRIVSYETCVTVENLIGNRRPWDHYSEVLSIV